MAHCVHAAVQQMDPSRRRRPPDCASGIAKRLQLPHRHDTVLPIRQTGQEMVANSAPPWVWL